METIIIAGGSGMIGVKLQSTLRHNGYTVKILTRNHKKVKDSDQFLYWNIDEQLIDERFQEVDHIVNLVGEGIASKRWTKKRKKALLNSRLQPTRLLINELSNRSIQLKSFVSASAIGYYGDGGDKILTEDSPIVTHEFLSDVCNAWETEALKSKLVADQVTILRIGTVLTDQGGALDKMAKTIPYGIANYMGSGDQYMSWIHIEDLTRMILHVIKNGQKGIFNAVAPSTVSNEEFTKILKSVINPHAILLPAPAFGLKLALGEMSRLLLNSSRVNAEKILESGFEFNYPELRQALEHIYKNKKEG